MSFSAGKSSESLSASHRWMAYRYLSEGYGPGAGMMGRWGMMGNPDVPSGSYPYESPEDIDKRRYALGEVSREEYLQMLEDLKESE